MKYKDAEFSITKYHSKLVGVTFEGRQAVISTLNGDEPLRVRREPDNEYDPNAVAVDVEVYTGDIPNQSTLCEWIPIGYIAKDKNLEIAKSLDSGIPVDIKMASLSGGGGKSFGVNVELRYRKANQDDVAKQSSETKPIAAPTKEQMQSVLAYLTMIVDNSGKKAVAPTMYNSKLLGSSIEITEVDGHKRLEGYLSGSKFPAQFYPEFNSEQILKAVGTKHGLTDKELTELSYMWDTNGRASSSLGNAVHFAMENYDINRALGDKIKKVKGKSAKVGDNKALSRNPILNRIVKSFHETFGGDYVRFNEEFIWDKEFKFCGSVDRIHVVDMKNRIIRIQDYKTDADIHETKYQNTNSPFYELTQGKDPELGKELLDFHWLQLSFYAFILQRAGWNVEGLDIFWLNGKKLISGENPWEKFSHKVIDITKGIIGE